MRSYYKSQKLIRIILTSFIVVASSSCLIDGVEPKPQNKTLTYQNIIIMSDLSNRVKKRNIRDTTIINGIIQKFKKEFVKPGEKIGDRSSLSFCMFNTPILASVDIGKIAKLGEKQQFVNSTGKFRNKGLDHELNKFYEAVTRTYETDSNPGLDLIGLMIDKIENDNIIKKDTFFTDGLDTTFVKFENHIYIFTDGYLETDKRPATITGTFYFSETEIDKIRSFAQCNNVTPEEALRMNEAFRLTKAPQKKNSIVRLHVLETNDRDYDVIKGKWKYTHGLNDNDILKAVWKRWAKDSNFKGDLNWKSMNVSIPAVLN
jgi:hypothetical protein